MKTFFLRCRAIVREWDWWFVGSIAILLVVGLVIHYSIGNSLEGVGLRAFWKHFATVIAGVLVFIVLSLIDVRTLKLHPLVYVVLAFFLLFAVLVFGVEIKGTRGWFIIADFSLQPVELVKVFLILALASLFRHNAIQMREWRFLFLSGGLTVILMSLVLLQPDFGSAMMLFIIWFGCIVFIRTPWKRIASILLLGVGASVFAWHFLLEAYQKNRISVFLHPDADPFGIGYNITQSIIAIGSGSWRGRGLGVGTQSQLHFLPENATDFIFAVIAEDLGLLGVTVVFCCFGVILWRILHGLSLSHDSFFTIILLGTFSYLLIQTVVTIGMNVGLMPITGLPLPLLSAGGSSMIATLMLFGIVHRILITSKVRH